MLRCGLLGEKLGHSYSPEIHKMLAVLDSLGAEAVVISRRGEDNYNNLERHRDAGLIVNTTPLGMYPNNGVQAVDLTMFPDCRAVLDIVYNPARTALLQAEELGIKHAGGLHMLVAQAKRSSELFTGARIDDSEIGRIERALMHRKMNIVLVGMPGCGKTTVAGMIGRMTGRPVQDVDTMIEQRAGITIPEIFAQSGEEGFRKIETQIITEAGAQSGTVIATGGGSVTRQENYAPLHQNAVIVWLQRDIDKLPRDGRPLSARADLNEMYRCRAPMYSAFADMTADNNGTPEAAAEMILEALK